MSLLKDFVHLFYPKICVSCSAFLLKEEEVLCSFCLSDLPFMNIKNYENNKVAALFFGRVPIKKAVSFMYFRKHGVSQKLIHALKYKGNEKIGHFLGYWFGNQLKNNNVFKDVDCIIPVPLHPKKEKKRGYNQLTKFGMALSETLNIPYKTTFLQRVSTSQTQTLKDRLERFKNTSTQFYAINTNDLKGKHILLIDDVITTGATLEACCKELLKTENITISIATITYSEEL